jgi:hypothetical protein
MKILARSLLAELSKGAVMRRVVVVVLLLLRGGALVLVTGLILSACDGNEKNTANTSASSSTAQRGEPILIRDKLMVALKEHSEPVATGTILAGSTLGGAPFCAGGTIVDHHANLDPKMGAYLIDMRITCPNGAVRIGLTPKVSAKMQAHTQTGTWTIVSGTGVFEGLGGKGKSEAVYGPSPRSPVHEALTGTATR